MAIWSFKRNKSATDYKALMENDPGISGVVFLSASAGKDKDKHFSLDFRCWPMLSKKVFVAGKPNFSAPPVHVARPM